MKVYKTSTFKTTSLKYKLFQLRMIFFFIFGSTGFLSEFFDTMHQTQIIYQPKKYLNNIEKNKNFKVKNRFMINFTGCLKIEILDIFGIIKD